MDRHLLSARVMDNGVIQHPSAKVMEIRKSSLDFLDLSFDIFRVPK